MVNESEDASIEILDGLLGLMPADADRSMTELSTLLDAYRMAEMAPEGGIGLFRLSSIPIDQLRPNESLRATTVFCIGLDGSTLLSAAQIAAFEGTGQVTAEPSSEVPQRVPPPQRIPARGRGTQAVAAGR